MNNRMPSMMDFAERGIRAMEAMAAKEAKEDEKKAPSKSDNNTPKLTVETVYNHLYFYSDVNTDRCLAMIKAIREMDASLRNERATRSLPDEFPHVPIWLHIHSGGGEMAAGFGMADQLKSILSPIYSIVEGYCASSATLISLSCTKRYILPRSFMLIHQLSGVAWGTYEQVVDHVHLADMEMEQLIEFYVQNTKMTRAKIKQLLKRDSWFSSKECIELGLADEIRNGEH